MKIGSWRETHPWLFDTYFEGESGGGQGGGSGDGGGGAPAGGAPAGGGGQGGGDGGQGGGGEKTFTQAEVDAMIQGRVGETKRKSVEDLAKELGVPLDEAKAIIKKAKDADDAEKSDAQKAREAADKEKVEAETAKQEAAVEKHNARVERALIKALPTDLDDKDLDAKVGRLARLIDVEVGADEAAIKTAVEALKKDEPLLFGSTKGGMPPSDPNGRPPRKTGTGETPMQRGAERAKAVSGGDGYPILNKK